MGGRTPSAADRYAVAFRVGDEPSTAGALVVEQDRLLLEGSRDGAPFRLAVAYADLTQVRIGRSPAERLSGSKCLVLSRRDGAAVLVAPFGIGLLHELTNLIAALATPDDEPREQLTIVVPLKPGSLERVRKLIAAGPPFDRRPFT